MSDLERRYLENAVEEARDLLKEWLDWRTSSAIVPDICITDDSLYSRTHRYLEK